MQKFEFVGGTEKEVNNPSIDYMFIFAPQAEKITAHSADKIFCRPDAEVNTPCDDVMRGNWYLKEGYVLSKDDETFKYKLDFKVRENEFTLPNSFFFEKFKGKLK